MRGAIPPRLFSSFRRCRNDWGPKCTQDSDLLGYTRKTICVADTASNNCTYLPVVAKRTNEAASAKLDYKTPHLSRYVAGLVQQWEPEDQAIRAIHGKSRPVLISGFEGKDMANCVCKQSAASGQV